MTQRGNDKNADLKYRRWVFTWNAYSMEEGETITYALPTIFMVKDVMDSVLEATYFFQQEKGALTGRMHYQGFFELKRRMRKQTILKLINQSDSPIEILSTIGNLTIERMEGSIQSNITYCSKSDTKVMGPYCSSVYQGSILRDIDAFASYNMFLWQKDLTEIIFNCRDLKDITNISTPDDRSVYLITDKWGNSGKSKYVKYLCYKYNNIIKLSFGNATQLRAAVISAGPKQVYFLDIPRTLGCTDTIDDLLSVVEDIKNGFVCSSMYGKYLSLMMAPPHIIIFTNKEIDTRKLSADRWIEKEINSFKSFNFGLTKK